MAYLVAGLAWVVGSDAWLQLGPQADTRSWAGTVKGVTFVALSAALLYVVQSLPPRARPAASARNLPWRAWSVLIACALGVVGLGYGVYLQQAEQVRQRASASLANAAELTARQIVLWVSDRQASLEYAATDSVIATSVRRSLEGDAGTEPMLLAVLEHIRQSDDFEGVELIAPGGTSLVTAGHRVPWTPKLELQAEAARRTDRAVVSDLYVPDGAIAGRPVLDMVIALDDALQGRGHGVVLVARADPERFLYPALRSSENGPATPVYGLARLASDGDTVLMFAEVPTLQPGALRLTRPGTTTAAAQVVHGRAGVFETVDHRGTQMLATGHAVEGTPWYVIAKVPLAQVYTPLLRLARIALVLALGGLAVAAMLVMLWWRSESAFLASRVDAAEERASRLQQHFAVAGRLVQDVVLLIDAASGTIIEANDRASEAYGYTRDELLRMTVRELRRTGSAGQGVALQRLDEVVRAGHGTFNVQHYRKDGSPLSLEISARMLTIGKRTYVQTIGRDIGERLEHERRLAVVAAERDSLLERMQLQFERMGSACMVISPEGRLLQVNPAFEDTFGYPAASVVGVFVNSLLKQPAFREEALARLADLTVDPDVSYSGVHENQTARGKAIVCRWRAAAMRTADGTVRGFIVMADDITGLVKTERALRASEERYRALTEDSPVGIFRADLAGNVLFMNRRAQEVTGYDFRSSVPDGWVPTLHPDDAGRVIRTWRSYLTGNGTQPHQTEFRLLRRDGRVAWMLAQTTPEQNAEGVVIGHIGTITDVTEMKQAQLELEQARNHLEQRVRERTQELEAAKDAAEHSDRVKTTFLSTMSHELRTPLNSILGFTDVLLQGLSGPLTEDQERQLRIVRDSSTQLRALVEDVLDISRIEAGQVGLEFDSVDLRCLLERKVAAFAPEAARKQIRLELDAGAASTWVRSDSRRLAQIVTNLVSNAIKFTDTGGVTVSLQAVKDRIELVVEDTGVGIPAPALDQIFDPFLQVARPGGRLRDGAGLGLAIARNLARALGGDIEVRSEPGLGSRFTFWLPATARVEAATDVAEGAAAAA
ncbi:MAG TPA: PAS domain S-box protein [Steroidobacteraceae bacterium]|nr:PAS domain S-box protein [Steroidobacteraceae bacterium]